MSKHSIYIDDDLDAFITSTFLTDIGLSNYLQRLLVSDIYDSGLMEAFKQHVLTRASDGLERKIREVLPYWKDDAQR